MHISCFLWRNVVIKFPVHCEGICYTQCNVTLKLTHIIEKKIASVLKIATVFFSKFELFCCRPDGTKKAYVRLTPDYDALDVANKIGII